jgi:hypothetical protein
MERRTPYLLLMVVLLGRSVALAQVVADPSTPAYPVQPAPVAPATAGPVAPQAVNQPAVQPVAPPAAPGQPVYTAPPGQPMYAAPGQLVYAAPGQPVYAAPGQPAPGQYVLVPAQPVYAPVVPWGPPPSPMLGMMPGDSTSRWDINVDALWLERDLGRGVGLGATNYGYNPHSQRDTFANNLWSDDVWCPLEPGIRFQLIGRITDQMAVETTAWGLQQWSVGRNIYTDPGGGVDWVRSPWLQARYFDNAVGYSYESQVANVELNQRFKLYSFDPYRVFSWLWGVRYFYLADDFTLSGSNFDGSYEHLNWRTKNNLIGMQLGLQWAWGWDRVQLCTEAKIGLYANVYSQHETDSAGGYTGFTPIDQWHDGTDLSALFELSILLRYRITSCTWARLGYQFYSATGLALGPRQLGGRDAGGSLGMDGLSLGIEVVR